MVNWLLGLLSNEWFFDKEVSKLSYSFPPCITVHRFVEICKLSYQFLSMRIHLWEFSLAAQALALPFAPPYLQPNATFYKGVNFASGGSGLLNTTNPGLVRFHFSCKFISVSTNIAYKNLWILKSYIMFATIIHQVDNGLDIMRSPL
jgi:hypothetical protein